MAHTDQFTATGPSNVGAGFPRAAFSDNNQSGLAPQDSVCGVNVQGSEFGVYGECLPSGKVSNAVTDRIPLPNIFTGVAGRAVNVGVLGEGGLAGVIGTAIRDKDPSQPPNATLVGCLGGLPNDHGTSTALIGVWGTGSFVGVLGTTPGFTTPPPNTIGDAVVGVTANPGHTAVHGIATDPTARGGLFESAGIAQVSLKPALLGSKLPVVGLQGDLFARQEANADGAPEVGLYLCIRQNSPQGPALWQKIQVSAVVFQGGS